MFLGASGKYPAWMEFRYEGNASRGGTGDPSPRRWRHYAATVDGRGSRIYIDGHAATSVDGTGPRVIQAELFGKPVFTGRIDEVALYDRALSGDEIWDHFALGPKLKTCLATVSLREKVVRQLFQFRWRRT